MTATELIAHMEATRTDMDNALAGLTDAQLTEPGVVGDWTVKDILAHLTAWEVELVTVLGQFGRGQKPRPVPWADEEVEALNAKWHVEYQSRPLERVLEDFEAVRLQTIRQVERLTPADLATPRPWIHGHTLTELIRIETYEHEAEHVAHLRQWRAARGY